MKRYIYLFIILWTLPMSFITAQTYDNLWRQVSEAQENDLPQTELQVLQKIAGKAKKERAYGQLLKACLMQARAQSEVAPDSLQPAVERLHQQAVAMKDYHLQAIYYAVLGRIYQSNQRLSVNWEQIAEEYYRKALEFPAELAAVKIDSYKPFVMKGENSEIYGDDLLSLIGHETRRFRPVHDYYMTTANRRAQLMSGLYLLKEEEPEKVVRLSKSNHIRRLDSLANAYVDLTECGEVAIARYEFMDEKTAASNEDRLAYIDEALKRWGSWPRMNVLRNARARLTSSKFSAQLDHQVWVSNRPRKLELQSLRGIDQISIYIYKVKADGDIDLNPDDNEDYKKLKSRLTLLPELTQTRTYTGKNECEQYDDTLQMPALPVGVYMMEVDSKPKTKVARSLFFVSDVRVIMQALPYEHDNQLRYVVVNATTGKPIAGAQLRLTQKQGFNSKEKVLATLTTDRQGEAIYRCQNQERPNNVFATTASDRACPAVNSYLNFNYYPNERDVHQTAIYTDRSIYRPGQTVHVAAICYDTCNGFEHEVKAGKKVEMTLRDANYKLVAERELFTDEFGTVSTEFALPTSGLTGRYTIEVDNQRQRIHVEEYKRPTFAVEFPKYEQDYKDGDTLTVKATARTYSGVPVQGAGVKYKVERRVAFWWLSYSHYWQGGSFGSGMNRDEIFSGETMTADDGTFEVQMPMVLPLSRFPQFYNFVVEAEVTDLGGETHHGELSLPLGNCESTIVVELSDKVLAEDMPKLKLRKMNAAGNDVSALIRYQIDGGKWFTVQSNTSVELPKLKSGEHKLKVECEGMEEERKFVVFSLNDKRPACETDDWFYVSSQRFPNDSQPVTLQVGSSKDVHIVYTLIAGNEIVEMGAVDKNDELINRKLTYKPEYGNGLTLSYVWVYDGKTYTHEEQIQRPLPDKTLKMKWVTFRDRLVPGQQEEWTLKIEGPDHQPASKIQNVQLMATLYDKSIDQLAERYGKRVWTLEPTTWLPMAWIPWHYGEWGHVYCSGFQREFVLPEKSLKFNHFDADCIPRLSFGRHRLMMTRNKSVMADALEPPMMLREVSVSSQRAKEAVDEDGAGSLSKYTVGQALQGSIAGMNAGKELEVNTRENLQETAFFFPQLMADSTGCVSMKFTLPESLTTWRFMGLAHTKDMIHGFMEGEAVAQKDVMIQPNVPRFLRVGDDGTISARVFNTTDQEQSGVAKLQLIDPDNNNVVYSAQKDCLIKANGTSAVTFRVEASKPEAHSLLICKVSIVGENYSDGEQHYLPILSDKERVTVTVPFTQHEPGTKNIDLTTLVPTDAQHATLTVEYTNNPVWLMIQALPTMGQPRSDDAISQAASLYVNLLGQHIVEQNPTVKTMFEQWMREQGKETSLQSNLSKDEELKDLLLDETPWVMDAVNESEQKRLLSGFFDSNNLQQRITSATEKLSKLQRNDGSWSWWPGMTGSTFMTVGISEMLVRLNQMTGQQDETKAMLANAFRFMGKEMVKLVDEMKKQEKKGMKQHFPNHTALEWLYVCALDGRTLPADVQNANSYLKKLLTKDVKNQTIYEKALSSIVLNSSLYIKSLKEWTVYSEEMGRYYDTPRASYSWRNYRIPTQVAAIEALQRLAPNDQLTIQEMQRWLLQEKRTTCWDTPISSVEAIYAFLNGNSQSLSTQPKTLLSIDDKPLETNSATAGIGYVKVALPATNVHTFAAEKQSTGTSWGAVYAQFMQKTSDISDRASGIGVKREVIGDTPLTIGSRVKIRITIQADRDYDFVQVIDRRAACLEPVHQLSGYRNGYYITPKDCTTNYYFDMLHKGKHVVETEYYMDREGQYETGSCTVECAYAPEFRGVNHSQNIIVTSKE